MSSVAKCLFMPFAHFLSFTKFSSLLTSENSLSTLDMSPWADLFSLSVVYDFILTVFHWEKAFHIEGSDVFICPYVGCAFGVKNPLPSCGAGFSLVVAWVNWLKPWRIAGQNWGLVGEWQQNGRGKKRHTAHYGVEGPSCSSWCHVGRAHDHLGSVTSGRLTQA